MRFHLDHLPEVQAAIAAAAACHDVDALRAAAVAFDACDHVRDNPARPGGPGPVCVAERPVMFLGKSPAATESGTAIPFSGPMGQVLREGVAELGWDLDAAHMTCATWWRAKDNLPKSTQLSYSRPFLWREIELVRPSVIVVLGDKALEGLAQERGPIGPKVGQWRTFDPDGLAIPAIVSYCHAHVGYGRSERMPAFQANLLKAAEAHPLAFDTLRAPRALAA